MGSSDCWGASVWGLAGRQRLGISSHGRVDRRKVRAFALSSPSRPAPVDPHRKFVPVLEVPGTGGLEMKRPRWDKKANELHDCASRIATGVGQFLVGDRNVINTIQQSISHIFRKSECVDGPFGCSVEHPCNRLQSEIRDFGGVASVAPHALIDADHYASAKCQNLAAQEQFDRGPAKTRDPDGRHACRYPPCRGRI